jgi:hypothetical protein
MNLNELELTRKLKQIRGSMIGSKLADVVHSHGWTLLGRGSEGAVAEHPTKNYVLKIWPTSSLYTRFVQLVQRYPNPHFPRFSKVMKALSGTQFSYVRMEKLTKVTDYDLVVSMPECWCAVAEIYKRVGVALPGWIDQNHQEIDCTNISPDAKQVVRLMTAQLKKIGPRLDLHPVNIMRRGNTWVITDPYY